MKLFLQGFTTPIFKSLNLKKISLGAIASTTFAFSMTAYSGDDLNPSQKADLIFENGTVYTVDAKRSEAKAVAVKDGKIVYVGNVSGLKNWRGKQNSSYRFKRENASTRLY